MVNQIGKHGDQRDAKKTRTRSWVLRIGMGDSSSPRIVRNHFCAFIQCVKVGELSRLRGLSELRKLSKLRRLSELRRLRGLSELRESCLFVVVPQGAYGGTS